MPLWGILLAYLTFLIVMFCMGFTAGKVVKKLSDREAVAFAIILAVISGILAPVVMWILSLSN